MSRGIKHLQLNLDLTSYLFSQLFLKRDFRESSQLFSYGRQHFVTMEASSSGKQGRKNKSNSLPTPTSVKEESASAVPSPPTQLQPSDEGRMVQKDALRVDHQEDAHQPSHMPNSTAPFFSDHNTDTPCEGPSNILEPIISYSSILDKVAQSSQGPAEVLQLQVGEESPDTEADGSAETKEPSPRQETSGSDSRTLLLSTELVDSNVDVDASSSGTVPVVVEKEEEEPQQQIPTTTDRSLHEVRVIKARTSFPVQSLSLPYRSKRSETETCARTRRKRPEFEELFPQLERKLGLHLLLYNLNRTESFPSLAEGNVSLSLPKNVQVYKMEKKPERIVVKQDELWFHRPTWTEYSGKTAKPKKRKTERMHDDYRILTVDETNATEDAFEAELFMMHNRVVRSNQAAMDSLLDFEDDEDGGVGSPCLTPIGFEYSDIVLERKFLISEYYRIACLFVGKYILSTWFLKGLLASRLESGTVVPEE
jgi:hypothetical protein